MATTATTRTIEIKISAERGKTFMEVVKLVKMCGGTFDGDRKVWTVTDIPSDGPLADAAMTAMDSWTAHRMHFYTSAMTITEAV